jgi:excisionase family DNA binding protein
MNKYQFEKRDKIYYMDVKMVSEYIHFAKSTIYKWVGEDYIPHKKLGKRVLFIKNDIDQWVQNNGRMVLDDLPEVPKSLLKAKDPVTGIQNIVEDLNPQTKELGNIPFKYRRAG